jgi:hypothetical protein
MTSIQSAHFDEQSDAVVEEIISACQFALKNFKGAESTEKIVELVIETLGSVAQKHGSESALGFHLHLTTKVLIKLAEVRNQ